MNGDAPRVQFGIDGLDRMLGGGLIRQSICSVIGTYGTGKTTLALHFAHEGLKNGDTVIYLSLDEREEMLYRDMEQKGWEIEGFRDTSLYVIKLDPTDFTLSINHLKNELPQLIREVGADRVIIDPISLFEGLFPDEATRRRELFRFIEIMRDEACTLLLTSETRENGSYSSKYALAEYVADTVILLRYVRSGELAEVHPAVEVAKMRGSDHSRGIKPYEILRDRVQVYFEANVF